MAVVYFTSNASTGAGSLTEAVLNAQPGDVVRPDETVFERGATIEIVLASALTIDKNLTLDGGPFRVRLDGGGTVVCANVEIGVSVTFAGFEFISSSGAGVVVNGSTTFERCVVSGSNGAGVAASGASVTLSDSVVCGNNGAAFIVESAAISGSTLAGNVGASSGAVVASNSMLLQISGATTENGNVVNVAASQIGFVASPPDDLTPETWSADAWQNWDLRLLDDASGAPSPYRDSGDVGAMSRYDLDGNFRGRETNDVSTCSPGAYETLQADLFWIGRDATGAEIVSPSFLASKGWAASRFATVSGDVAPQVGQKLFVDGSVVFDDVLTTANANGQRFALTLGGGANVRFPSATVYLFDLQAGAASTFTFSNVRPSEARFGDWSRLSGTFSALPKYDVGSQVYIQAAFMYSYVQPSAFYGTLTVYAQVSQDLRLDGAYECDVFRIRTSGTTGNPTVGTTLGTTVSARVIEWGSESTTFVEKLTSEPITFILRGAASVTVPGGAPENWADHFIVDVSEATSAALTLSGQIVYGDAPTCVAALTGSAKIDERGLTSQSLTLNADAALTVDGAEVSVGALTVADGATVVFSGIDAILTATETATIGDASFMGIGYFATPPVTDTSSAVFAENVRNCDYGANVSSFSSFPVSTTVVNLSWVKQNQVPCVLIEEANGNEWNIVNNRADGESLVVDISAPKTFRLFDGENFFTSSARPYGTAYELAEEQTIGYLKTLISTGYLN